MVAGNVLYWLHKKVMHFFNVHHFTVHAETTKVNFYPLIELTQMKNFISPKSKNCHCYCFKATRAIVAFYLLFSLSMANAQDCLPNGIVFTDQQQVDQFTAMYTGCKHVGGFVYIQGSAITNVDSLYTIESIGSDLFITNNDALTSLSGLENLEIVHGAVRIQSNPQLEDLNGLNGLQRVAGDYFYIGNNTILRDVSGLSSLDTVGGLFHIWANDSIISLEGMNNLKWIGSDLNIFNMPVLEAIQGFGDLNTIAGALRITDNPQLQMLDAFNHSITINGALVITNNQLLKECAVQSICDYLADPAAFIVISDNDNGCNSIMEVNQECLSALEDGIGKYNSVYIYPNPATHSFTLHNESAINGEIIISDAWGRLMWQSQSLNNLPDITHWQNGVYMVAVISNNDPHYLKLVIKR